MIINYFIWNFLIDEREHLNALQSKLEKCKASKQTQLVLEILHEIEEVQLQARQLYLRHRRECPPCVWNYFIGRTKEIPTYTKIMQGLSHKKGIFKGLHFDVGLALTIAFAIWVVYEVIKSF